jgi:acyl carrier protein
VIAAIEDKVIEIIARESGLDRARITGDSTLKDLEILSLDFVQIMFAIEEEFKIYLPTNDPGAETGSVSGLVAEIERQIAAKTA